MGAAAGSVSQDVLISRAELLLEEWGMCQRFTAGARTGGGECMEAKLMRNLSRRSKTDKRQRFAWQRKRRMVEIAVEDANGGELVRLVPAEPMYPDRVDKQTDVGAVGKPEQWPGHIERLERVLAMMPVAMVRVAVSRYVYHDSLRDGAQQLRISKDEFGRRLDRIRWYVIGNFAFIDAEG